MSRDSHVTNHCLDSHIDLWLSLDIWLSTASLVACVCVLRYKVRMIYDAHINASCLSQVTHVNKSCHTCGWVMTASFVAHVCVLRSNVRMTCHAHSNESCHACECATPHLRMSHDRLSCSLRVCLEEQRVNDACVVSLVNAASHIWMRHVIYERVMPHAMQVC